MKKNVFFFLILSLLSSNLFALYVDDREIEGKMITHRCSILTLVEKDKEVEISDLDLNKPVPDFLLKLLDGRQLTYSKNFRAKVPVIITFWTPWCSNCKNYLLEISNLYNKIHDNVEIIAVCSLTKEHGLKELKKFAKENKIKFYIVVDEKNILSENIFKLSGLIPASFVIDRSGVIRHISLSLFSSNFATIFKKYLESP